MDKIKIAFTYAFDVDHDSVFKSFNLLTPNNDGVWNNLIHVKDVYEADWIIACDYISPNLNLDKIDLSKVIFVQREPPWFQIPRKNDLHIKHRYGYSLGNSHMLSGWSWSSTYQEMKHLKYKKRDKKVCAIISNKKTCQGHLKRLNFIKYFCQRYPGVLDVYGAGMDKEGLGDNFKGQSVFGDGTKLDWLTQYEYSICLENGQINGYFSEKIVDAFMAYTVPIYWGAPDIKNYFPEKSFYTIDVTNSSSPTEVLAIISRPVTQAMINNLQLSRNRVMEQYNWWPSIQKIIASIGRKKHE